LGKNKDVEQIASLEEFIESGRIDEILGIIKSGKEATVYLCSGGALIEEDIVAAKVYRSLDVRNFRDDATYRHGRTRGSSREDRGVRLKTRSGREVRFAQWIGAEYETLRILHQAGCDVPRPIAHAGGIILMEYICDAHDEAAPSLAHAHVPSDEASAIFERLISNIELMLAHDRVHGDLSPYNVLYRGRGRISIIDFPQTIDARVNANALALLERDIDRICAWAARFGVDTDAVGMARRMWRGFVRSEL
jgi:RIO kinase 1